MRIGFLTYGFDRYPTGIGRYALELLQALAALPGCPEILLLTTEREDQTGLWDRFEHHSLPGCRLLPSLMTVGNLLLDQAARRYRLDVVHDPNGIAPFLGPWGKAKRVVTIHDAFAYIHPKTNSLLENLRFRMILPSAAKRADAIVTISECSRKDLVKHLNLQPERVQITLLGVPSRFKPVADGQERQAVLDRYRIQKPYLLYIGGINSRKNIARLLEAFALVRGTFPELSLMIGGKRQWGAGNVDLAVDRLKLNGSAHFAGYIPDADLPALYSAAEVFVFPSLYEGFGLPPLEAMACGCPVVASTAGALPEVVGEAGLTVNPYHVGELAEAIVRLLHDPDLQADLRQRGFQRASHFTWDRTARETLNIYKHLEERAAS